MKVLIHKKYIYSFIHQYNIEKLYKPKKIGDTSNEIERSDLLTINRQFNKIKQYMKIQ